ncbi:MAG: hypothetical protein JWM53_638 [bacterium]|nr:hypothetical protein [bacterium]
MTMNACNVPWPVCPDCLGEPLDGIAAGAWKCPRCRRRFAAGERLPCPDVPTVMVRDTAGGGGLMCRSHGVRARVMIVGSTVEGLDDGALAVAATPLLRAANIRRSAPTAFRPMRRRAWSSSRAPRPTTTTTTAAGSCRLHRRRRAGLRFGVARRRARRRRDGRSPRPTLWRRPPDHRAAPRRDTRSTR